ncbi:MAG TPA: STAS domain-containing protein [Candidatus Dormibacteraeota bacterium]|nr:STAS domain-containing protein [Candidatus Dormibacteraeota bacterium]
MVTRTLAPVGLRFTGEIDLSNVHAVTEALRACGNSGDLHLDLDFLSFCDISGIRALVAHAERRDDKHRLMLHGLPAQIERVLDVVGWAELPGLAFCNCEVAA